MINPNPKFRPARKTPNPRLNKLTLRLTDEELTLVEHNQRAAGFSSRSDFLRCRALRNGLAQARDPAAIRLRTQTMVGLMQAIQQAPSSAHQVAALEVAKEVMREWVKE